MSKFIVIRGPSGAGKSTVSKHLQTVYPRRTLLIHEDNFRFMFSNWREPNHTASKVLVTAAILSGLESGYDVIYEGISNVKTYDTYFQQIFAVHPQENYFFYLDVDFEETLKRHETRPEKAEFGPAEMKTWLEYATPTGYKGETIIPKYSTLDETVTTILRITK